MKTPQCYVAAPEQECSCVCGQWIAAGDWLYDEKYCSSLCAENDRPAPQDPYEAARQLKKERIALECGYEDNKERCKNCGKWFWPNHDGNGSYDCAACIPIVEAKAARYLRMYGSRYPAEYQERDEQQAAEAERFR